MKSTTTDYHEALARLFPQEKVHTEPLRHFPFNGQMCNPYCFGSNCQRTSTQCIELNQELFALYFLNK